MEINEKSNRYNSNRSEISSVSHLRSSNNMVSVDNSINETSEDTTEYDDSKLLWLNLICINSSKVDLILANLLPIIADEKSKDTVDCLPQQHNGVIAENIFENDEGSARNKK